MTGNIDDLFALTFTTYDRIREEGGKDADAVFSLYVRYLKQVRMQKTDETKSLDFFMQSAMGWSQGKFKKVKKILIDLGLIEQIRGFRGEAKVKVKYIIGKEKTEKVGERQSSEEQPKKSDVLDSTKNDLSSKVKIGQKTDSLKIDLQNIYNDILNNKNNSIKNIYPPNSFFYKISRDFLDFQTSQNVHQILFFIKKQAEKITYKSMSLKNYGISEVWKKENIREEIAKMIISNIWADEVRKLQELDGYTEQQIQFVFNFTKKHNFWKNQILSVQKFREKNRHGIPFFTVIVDEIRKQYNKKQEEQVHADDTGIVFAPDNF